MLCQLGCILWLIALAEGALFGSFSDLPDNEFDFVVVGGGTAGNVVANRLSEDPSVSVLVLEAGGSDRDVLVTQVPFFCARIISNPNGTSPYNWNYTTIPQTSLGGRVLQYTRGHILGGSSSINYMAYTRGTADDYDRWSKVTGDRGWSWNALQKYIHRNEKFVQPVDHHNTRGQFDPRVHGFHGINSVSLPGYQWTEFNNLIGKVLSETKEEFPYSIDTNSGDNVGLGWGQATTGHGTRSSSATSYLGPKFIGRPNLSVLIGAQVMKLVQTNNTPKEFLKVAFSQDSGVTNFTVTARREVILSAGSIGSPHILMHSGIGAASTLASHNITPLHDLPSVGQNLSDHPLAGNSFFVNANTTIDAINRNDSLRAQLLEQWEQNRTGPLGNVPSTFIGFFRFPENSTVLEGVEDPSAGPKTGHFEMIVANGMTRLPIPPTGNFLGLTAVLVTPTSRGFVSLNSSNPFDPPVINPNFLSTPYDIRAIREAYRATSRFASAPAFNGYIASSVNPANQSDAELDALIRNTTTTIYHPVGTAAMSAREADYGVVDPDLKVKGIKGLRVVDASVMPFITSGHTQVPVYIIAERAADLIKASHSPK